MTAEVPRAVAWAERLAVYPSCSAAASTRSRYDCATCRVDPLSTRDAVASDTPAARATSWRVAERVRADASVTLAILGGEVGRNRGGEAGGGAVDRFGRVGVPDVLVEELDLDVAVVAGGEDGTGHRLEVDDAVARVVPAQQHVQ